MILYPVGSSVLHSSVYSVSRILINCVYRRLKIFSLFISVFSEYIIFYTAFNLTFSALLLYPILVFDFVAICQKKEDQGRSVRNGGSIGVIRPN